MDYSKFRRAPIEQQTPQELQNDLQAVTRMTPEQQLLAMSGSYVPNYPVQASPDQLANPMAQSMGIQDILALLLRQTPDSFDSRFEGSKTPLPRPRPK